MYQILDNTGKQVKKLEDVSESQAIDLFEKTHDTLKQTITLVKIMRIAR